jgi:hypothetical protein
MTKTNIEEFEDKTELMNWLESMPVTRGNGSVKASHVCGYNRDAAHDCKRFARVFTYLYITVIARMEK